jgi:benzil reductase ((S)-benzoin forming)
LKQSSENAQNVFQVNYLSAVEIAIKALDSTNCRQIFFISSGAANRPISSWSQYGASKAALNYFAETLQQECHETNRKVVIKSIAPGVVDTPMQEQIRQLNPENFPTVEYFRNLKKEQELSSAEEVARKLLFVSLNPEQLPSVCMSLRDIP